VRPWPGSAPLGSSAGENGSQSAARGNGPLIAGPASNVGGSGVWLPGSPLWTSTSGSVPHDAMATTITSDTREVSVHSVLLIPRFHVLKPVLACAGPPSPHLGCQYRTINTCLSRHPLQVRDSTIVAVTTLAGLSCHANRPPHREHPPHQGPLPRITIWGVSDCTESVAGHFRQVRHRVLRPVHGDLYGGGR
jgi:hypothetical protein